LGIRTQPPKTEQTHAQRNAENPHRHHPFARRRHGGPGHRKQASARRKGDRLDWCQNWSTGCGKAAADAFCQATGYQNATNFEQAPNIGATQKTRLIATGAVCDQDFCDGFKYVTCFKPNPTTVVVNQPKWQGDRLDWCSNWSTGCGKTAADAFCKASGLQPARQLPAGCRYRQLAEDPADRHGRGVRPEFLRRLQIHRVQEISERRT
jgi:hypothetical protein